VRDPVGHEAVSGQVRSRRHQLRRATVRVDRDCDFQEPVAHLVEVSPKKIARLSLDHWLNDVCPECFGTGFRATPDSPSLLSDIPCKACKGTAKRQVQAKHNLLNYVSDMVESLEAMTVQAGREAVRKLATAFSF